MKNRPEFKCGKLLVFVEKMKRGLHIEYRETIEIPTAVLKSSVRMRPSAFQAKKKALVREESPPEKQRLP
ncbi:MAG: hypothetical protein PHO65_08370 [Sulfurovum sp.]|nr:hypothetical protein [Sulfurovum sp.]